MSRHALAPLLAALAMAVTACGGDGDSDAIEDVLQTGLTSTDTKVICEGTLTTALMERIYGGAEECRKAEADDAKQDQAEKVEVSDVQVDGDTATARIEIEGGGQDGSRGPLELKKRGDDWRVDGLSTELLFSQFEAGLKSDRQFAAKTKTCLSERVGDLPPAELRDLAYDAIGERPEGTQKLVELIAACEQGDGSGEPGLIRRKFEEGVARSMKREGASEAEIACAQREMRKRITDQEIGAAIGAGGEVPAAIRRDAEAAIRACLRQG